jgi:hypothetical protein
VKFIETFASGIKAKKAFSFLTAQTKRFKKRFQKARKKTGKLFLKLRVSNIN